MLCSLFQLSGGGGGGGVGGGGNLVGYNAVLFVPSVPHVLCRKLAPCGGRPQSSGAV